MVAALAPVEAFLRRHIAIERLDIDAQSAEPRGACGGDRIAGTGWVQHSLRAQSVGHSNAQLSRQVSIAAACETQHLPGGALRGGPRRRL